MTDTWTPGPAPLPPAPIPPGLQLSDTWSSSGTPCAPSGVTSIVDNVILTGVPAGISSVVNGKVAWSVVLNDAATPPNYNVSRYDSGGNLLDLPMAISGVDGTITFNDDVILAEDPVEPMQAATKQYVDTAVGTPAVIPNPSTTNPLMDGAVTPGVGVTYARGDHVHPIDTSRYAASNPSGYQTAAQVTAVLPIASSSPPVMDGTAAIGSAVTWAKADHVHPSDTSRLPLTGGTLTGPLTPAGIVGTTTNNNAATGQVGEVISTNVLNASALTMTSGAALMVASIPLTAGDWDVTGEIWINVGTGGLSGAQAAIAANSAALPTDSALTTARHGMAVAFTASTQVILPLRLCRVLLAAPATYYLLAQAGFATGTCTAFGNILARRAR